MVKKRQLMYQSNIIEQRKQLEWNIFFKIKKEEKSTRKTPLFLEKMPMKLKHIFYIHKQYLNNILYI